MTTNQNAVDPYKPITDGKNQRLKLTTDTPFTPTYVQQGLTLSSDPARVYEARVQGRHVLLENPARESKAKKEWVAKQARKRAEKDQKKLRPLGRNAAASKGLWKLEKHATRFALFVPLHQLWMDYMSELLGLGVPDPSSSHESKMPSASSMHAKLVKADLNGALLTVRQSRNPCLVGLSGIVLHETENAFKLITQKNQLKLVPKQNSIFALAVPLYSILPGASSPPEGDVTEIQAQPAQPESRWTVLDKPFIEFDLYGNQFCFRSADRSNKKFKAKETIEL